MTENWRLTAISALLVSLLILSGCKMFSHNASEPLARLSIEQLIEIVKASDPNSPGYEPGFEEVTTFGAATSELARRGPVAAPAAVVLGRALRYPRRDSYMAAKALAAIGPAAEPAIPELVIALQDSRALVRTCTASVLGVIGEPSRTAVPLLSQLLWDSDPFVRTAVAGAIERITRIDLVTEPQYELDPNTPCSVAGDEPEGSITGRARTWWMEEGQYLDWTEQANPQ